MMDHKQLNYSVEEINELLDKASTMEIPTVPTKTSELINDSNFVTKTYVDSAIGGGTISESNSEYLINVLTEGITTNQSDRASNTSILKRLIEVYPRGTKTFYFPKGTYYFDPIDLTSISGSITIKLKGENDGIHASWFNYQGSSIITNGQHFLYDLRNTSPGYKVYVDSMKFYSGTDYTTAPAGVCFGAEYNSGGEYNFHFYNVMIFGFDYGFKSPGYSCTGSGGKHFCVTNCHYGIYIAAASHLFNADGVELTNNVVGIRFGHGGNPCTISNIHIACGYLAPDKDNFTEYKAIHCKGDVHINGIYQEDYNGADAAKQIIIDYEGHASGVGPVIVENTPIILPSASGGLFFRGATYFGNGPEAGVTSPTTIYSGNLSHYPDGCVKFVNCPVRSRTDITDIFEVPAQSPGYDINGKIFIANNSIISKNPYGRINSKWTSVLTRNGMYDTNFFYELYSYEDLGTAYKGILPKNLSVLRTIDEKANIRLKGNLIIEDTLSPNIDVVFGFAHKYKDSNGTYVYDFHPITRLQGGQGIASFPFDITLDRYSTEDAFTNIIPATKVLESGITNSANSTKRLVYDDYLKIRLNFEIEQQRNM